MSFYSKYGKRGLDILMALFFSIVLFFPILIIVVLIGFELKSFGIFKQRRVGQHGVLFTIYKLKTLKTGAHTLNNMDDFTTTFTKFLRDNKLDELPQLWNILKGDMSFVGPRPDLPGFADKLEGGDRIILSVRPGLLSEASIKYKNEDQILKSVLNPVDYNRQVIWKEKVRLNRMYVLNSCFHYDFKLIFKSFILFK